MNRKAITAILALSAVFAISALAQAQSSTGKQTGLTNPGFEEPRGKEASFTFVKTMPGWKTTDTHFEIWSTGFQEVVAYEGTQFVELNAYIDGTLYQDSTGIQPGSVLEFTFAHRGRNGEDTMKLTITDLGADNSLDGGDDTVLFTNEYTTEKDAWAVYDSTKEKQIKALGNTVRFAYSAVHGTGGKGPDKTEGNFLDAANFGVGVVSETPPNNAMKLDVDGGAFTFGYSTTAKPGFTEFPNTDSPHPGIKRRNMTAGDYFSFAQNTRETDFKAQESDLVHYPAKAEGSGVLHPGQNPGDVAIARFTAMGDGEYHFKITAELIEENPTGAGVTIKVDGKVVDQTQLNKHLVPWTTSFQRKLTKGQTVDIAVDNGVEKNWEKDHVLITAKAWTTSPIPPANAMKLDVDGGAFTFGYSTTAKPGFTEFPNTDSPHPGIKRRNMTAGDYFSFAQNTRETDFKAQESDLVHYPAKAEGSGVLHPGQNPGDVAIARFTAMGDGEYHFKITAELIEENPTGAGVTIKVDGKVVDQTQLNKHLVPWTTSFQRKLTKGQTVDIAVDNGVEKNWERDHVLITAKAWTTGLTAER